MSAPLLAILPLTQGAGNRHPLMVEVPVPAETGPYLVTSSASMIWIDRPFKQGFVRAATRTISPPDLFASIIESIIAASTDYDWGAIVSTASEAESRMLEYDMGDFDILDHDNAPWLPASVSKILVPSDLGYLGTVFVAGDRAAAVVHNASRGISIVAA